ncbi:porin [Shinella curvata]|uniref:Porin n=1 Tax=Shinella curvata TaxID=1817964 RepID=A0ABT8XGC8_9HYPH|nr:porin [Shinella curvata]MCJ8053429.1 porin [Shinella curvata]MDO6122761.1 porin [Shinella curvata]
MNIKSLLLGSAAALAAVSGAQAADAIVAAEPEPMEYVRVCDAFGTGFFYIPGTETCLKIGGYVRFDVGGGERLGLDTNGANGYGIHGGDEWNTAARFTLNVETASDTEYGALKTFVETRFNYRGQTVDGVGAALGRDVYTGHGTDVSLNFAYIDLAGFRVGKTETAFYTFVGYAGNVINDDLISGGVYDANVIQYNYDNGSGLTAVISLEDTDGADSRRDYVPNIVGGLGYSTGAFGVKLVGGYDAAVEEGALKLRADGTFGGVSVFAMAGWNTDGDQQNVYATWQGDWAVWLGASAAVTERVTLNAQVSFDDGDALAAVANANFTVVPGFVVTPEVVYHDDGTDDSWGGMIRFQRSF